MRSSEKKIGPGDVAFTAIEIIKNIGSATNKQAVASAKYQTSLGQTYL